ncbi:MAG: HAMP domain-containing sensor histidine kinase [Pirellulaceae bacterium]|nr:HAMP domain-containing sensor histidine kinase [Pirellulaceae bacterium]
MSWIIGDSKSLGEERAAELKQIVATIFELSEKFRDQTADAADWQKLTQHSLDTRWQVRREVACALRVVPEELFQSIAARLREDSSALVKNNVRRVSKEREELQRKLGYTQRSVDEIVDRRETFERRFGVAALKLSDKLHDQLLQLIVGSMLHDIKSILTPLTYLSHESVGHRGNDSDRFRDIRKSVDFLNRSIRDMEDFVRPLAIDRTRECLADLVKDATEIAKWTAEQREVSTKKIRLLIDVPRSINLKMDRHLMVIAIANLVTNAYESFQWCDPQRRFEIRLAALSLENEVTLKIEDNGMGISKEEMISRSHFVPGRLNKSKIHSTGFGLANASRYFIAHGGYLRLFSKEDEGTTATIHLPKK